MSASSDKHPHAGLIRALDVVLALAGILASAPVMVVLALIGLFDTGSPFFSQVRVGKDKKPFTLYKLRTMKPGTAEVATHLASSDSVTPFGSFLRRTKLDELPQLWNVLVGDMTMVGPRPGLLSQVDLSREREARGVFSVRPGITGLAQVSGVDMSTPVELAELDALMIRELSLRNYGRFILLTIAGRGAGDALSS